MTFLVNAPRGAKRVSAKRRRKKAPRARARKRRAVSNPPAARRHNLRGPAMAKRKSRKRRNAPAAARSNPKRRRRRRSFSFGGFGKRRRARRSNPALGLSPRGIVNAGIQGAKDGAGVLAGEFIAGMAEQYMPGVTAGTTKAAAVATVATVAAGAVASRFVGRRTGEMIVAGAVAKFGRRVLKDQLANYPTAVKALGDYGLPLMTSGAVDYSRSLAGYNPAAGYVPGTALPQQPAISPYPY
jgi:hypothetical protein